MTTGFARPLVEPSAEQMRLQRISAAFRRADSEIRRGREFHEMKRHLLTPRANWHAQVEALGFTYHSHDARAYWDESTCYEFTATEVDELEAAANTLHQLCIDAAEVVIQRGWWESLGIPASAIPAIRASWDHDDPSVYGRFDLAYDGMTPHHRKSQSLRAAPNELKLTPTQRLVLRSMAWAAVA